EPHLPERLEVAGGDVREIQRRGTSASNPAYTAGDRGKLSQIRLESPQLSKGKARSDQRPFRLRHARHLQARVTHPRATAGPRAVHDILRHVMDHPHAQRTTYHAPNRHRV